MPDLAAWLLEQIAEDERAALPTSPGGLDSMLSISHDGDCVTVHCSRVLADCAAKRRIVEVNRFWLEHTPPSLSTDFTEGARELAENTLELLALPFADRPGYDEGWRA